MQTNDYDSFAEAYAAENESNFVNAHYERPAVLALAGEVTGHRILDAGCGAGPLAAALRERGATVTGLDKSAEMIALARHRLGDDADVHVGDLRDPFAATGFQLSVISELQPDPAARESFPDDFERLASPMGFLFRRRQGH
ncbi:class I SAM-dependent methyltransferase [Herbiconiux ginsengi]|uniref:class I SAM-dependent methyltransferase n=1 Tax=Herbiconiux ginsengi TaxID=381665 RepID=UPI000A689929|nr:class I SAM-dependent methyltransferase [Herbiconiux ginsengi]